MNENKDLNQIAFEKDKRLYYQYLGFLNTYDIFNKNIIDIQSFEILQEDISYEKFKNFKLDNHPPLGKRVEYFFEFYINNSKKYILLDKNIQIINNKITLGEFDFIIQDILTKEIFHIELVYKYYLYKQNEENEVLRYVGVNNHDILEERLNKLKLKQSHFYIMNIQNNILILMTYLL